LPDATILLDFILYRFTATLEKLEIYQEQMERNLWKTGGIVFAQRVMLALVEKGMARKEAYELLENFALTVRRGIFLTDDGLTYKELIFSTPEIIDILSEEELNRCFDPYESLKHVDTIFRRFNL